jgi:two-component system, cell cycle response regulator CtrA
MRRTALVREAPNAIGIHSPVRNHGSMIGKGNLIVDLERRIVTADSKLIRVTGKEYSILELLSLQLGVTVTKEMLLGHLYGGKDEPELKIIDVFVCHLRKKLAQATDGKHYIETVWGRGYRLCAPAEMPALPPSLIAARNLSM